jgi:hypothetical protein
VPRALRVFILGLIHDKLNFLPEERRARVLGLVKDEGNVKQEAHGLPVEVARRHGPPVPSKGARLTQVELGELELPEVGRGPGHK